MSDQYIAIYSNILTHPTRQLINLVHASTASFSVLAFRPPNDRSLPSLPLSLKPDPSPPRSRSRKLNSQLDRAIDEAMADLDRRSAAASKTTLTTPSPTTTAIQAVPSIGTTPTTVATAAPVQQASPGHSTSPSSTTPTTPTNQHSHSKSPRTRNLRQNAAAASAISGSSPLRQRPIKIAPAPPAAPSTSQQHHQQLLQGQTAATNGKASALRQQPK